MGFAKSIEGGHGRVAELLGRRDKTRLVAQGLRSEPDIAKAAKMAQVPAVRDALRPRRVAEHREDGIVLRARAPPRQHAVRGRDHDAVDPRAIGPRRREADRLEPFGIGRALAEGIAGLSIHVPADLRRVIVGRHWRR